MIEPAAPHSTKSPLSLGATNSGVNNPSRPRPRLRRTVFWLTGLVIVLYFSRYIHPLLAITQRVDADVLVVEGWVPGNVLDAAVQEFKNGHYRVLITSGINYPKGFPYSDLPSYADEAAYDLKLRGFDPNKMIVCATPFARWNRTSNSAQAVFERIQKGDIKLRGINVMTAGPHARETWVAYRHMAPPGLAVGVISVPVDTYAPNWWWASLSGNAWVLKNIVGALKEMTIGQRAS